MYFEIHEETVNGLTLRIISDDDPQSPREWDNLGTMVCFHGRYQLGDNHKYRDYNQFLEYLMDDDYERALRPFEMIDTWDMTDRERSQHYVDQHTTILDWIERHIFILPLYLYDHSGIIMNTTGFTCPWDSGRVGWIYATPERVRQCFGWQRITQARRGRVYDALRSEVAEYDQYLRGDVWGYQITDENGEDLDSCWGFYGQDYAIQEGQAILESLAQEVA